MTNWETVIGLEVHVQLGTATKAFSPSAYSYGVGPNTLTDPVILGLPGCLPTFNEQAMRYAVKLGLAMGCSIRQLSRFARKHYFYPDLPKGYQISQFDEPICEGGKVEFWLNDKPHSVRLTRIHLEEDAGKNTHQLGATSLVDLNRAGVPLCEIVSEPDLRSAEEAAAYMRAVRQMVRYLGISEGNMEQGNLRCDANVSIRPMGDEKYGERVELKNINSFRFVQKAIEHEVRRQTRIKEEGGTVAQETRLWDANAGMSISMRSKEDANDYRYFPDPDLPPLKVTDEVMTEVKNSLPELPMQRGIRLHETLGLPTSDAITITAEIEIANYFDQALKEAGETKKNAKMISNWMLGDLSGALNASGKSFAESPVTPKSLAELVELIDNATISGKIAKDVFAKMLASGDSAKAIVEKEGLVQITDAGAIEEACRKVINANPKQAEQYRNGKEALLGFFVGQLMKETRGKANPKMANEVLKKLLGE